MKTAIPLKNSSGGFGLIAIALHWIVAGVFIANFALVYALEWFFDPRSEVGRGLLSTHTALGVSVIVFVALRIIWRLCNVQPAEPDGSAFEHLAARAMHVLLYAVMILLPLTGYLGFGGQAQLFFAFELPNFQDTWVFQTLISGGLGLSWDSFEGAMDFIHKQGGAYIVSILILAHASAALYHHIIRKDDVLKRMVQPGLAGRPPRYPSVMNTK